MHLLYACYTVLNEEEYLHWSLRSVYPAVDRIIILEGATRFAPLCSTMGLSVDRTTQIILDFPDPEHKITYVPMGWVPNREVLRNWYLRYVPDDAWILVVDGDEIYHTRELLGLRKFIERNEDLVEIFPEHQELFWWDERWLKQLPENPDPLFFDRAGTRLTNGYIHERCYKRLHGLSYGHHTHVKDVEDRPLYCDSHYQKFRVKSPDGRFRLQFFHCGPICSRTKLLLKMVHLKLQNEFGCTFAEVQEQPKELDRLLNEAKADIRYCRVAAMPLPWPPVQLIPVDGPLPAVLKDHPYRIFAGPEEIPDLEVYRLPGVDYGVRQL